MVRKLTFVLLAIILAACSAAPTAGPTPTSTTTPDPTATSTLVPAIIPTPALVSNKQFSEVPQVEATKVRDLIISNQLFALDLYFELSKDHQNILFAPYSISQAVAMVYDGARSQTTQEIANSFHFELPKEDLHAAFNATNQRLSAQTNPDVALDIANSLWVRSDYSIKEDFLDTMAQYYGSGIYQWDKADLEGTRQAINEWVRGKTRDHIIELLKEPPTDDTGLYIVNTIYFQGTWKYPFAPFAKRFFNCLDGTGIDLMMMQTEAEFNYSDGAGYKAIELPYKDSQIVMDLLVPDLGTFDQFEENMTLENLNTIFREMRFDLVILTMPPFELKAEYFLKDVLSSLGMSIVFTEDSDFSGIGGVDNLHLSDILHSAFIKVSEKKTEASAATGVIVTQEVESHGEKYLLIDRPFIFLIRDQPTGTILFMGRVLDPRIQ